MICQDLDKRSHRNCVDLYKQYFTQLVNVVGNYHADILLFRTTTSGWMRWGNFGFAWPATEYQLLLLSSHSVKQMNEVAIDVVKQSKFDIDVLDYFWLTYPRPDDTQVQVDSNGLQGIGGHLVHPGIDINTLFTRKVLMVIMWKLCPSTLER